MKRGGTSSNELYRRLALLSGQYGFTPSFYAVTHSTEKGEKENRETHNNPTLSVRDKKLDSVGGHLVCALDLFDIRNSTLKREPAKFFHVSTLGGEQSKQSVFSLHIIGAPHSIAEAMIIKASYAIAHESGMHSPIVRINSIGDRDSSARFARELSTFFRRTVQELPISLQTVARQNVFSAYEQIIKKEHPLAEKMPAPIAFLSSESRRHFKEVLEHLEAADIPYDIDNSLMGSRECYSETLFSIEPTEEEAQEVPSTVQYPRGGRYDEFSKRFFRTTMPAVGAVFTLARPCKESSLKSTVRTPTSPKVFFIHVGFEAATKSLGVIEILRQTHVPFHHALGKISLSEHLRRAEEMSIPYLMLMGQKEAVEQSVIMRNIATRAQQTISLQILPEHLRSLR